MIREELGESASESARASRHLLPTAATPNNSNPSKYRSMTQSVDRDLSDMSPDMYRQKVEEMRDKLMDYEKDFRSKLTHIR